MKVPELIRLLSQMDQTLDVSIEDAEGHMHNIDDVYETEDEENEQIVALQVEKT